MVYSLSFVRFWNSHLNASYFLIQVWFAINSFKYKKHKVNNCVRYNRQIDACFESLIIVLSFCPLFHVKFTFFSLRIFHIKKTANRLIPNRDDRKSLLNLSLYSFKLLGKCTKKKNQIQIFVCVFCFVLFTMESIRISKWKWFFRELRNAND